MLTTDPRHVGSDLYLQPDAFEPEKIAVTFVTPRAAAWVEYATGLRPSSLDGSSITLTREGWQRLSPTVPDAFYIGVAHDLAIA